MRTRRSNDSAGLCPPQGVRSIARSIEIVRALLGVGLSSTLWACSQTPIVLPSRDLDRPTDMAFACVSAVKKDGNVVISGEPMGKCHPSGEGDNSGPYKPTVAIGDSPAFRTYAFATNTDRGDVSVIDMSYCRSDDSACQPPGASLVDLDPTSEGFDGIPVGTLPEVVAASQDGCRVVTANRGSCDLTLIDPSVLLTQHLDTTHEIAMPPRVADAVTVVPFVASGRLALAPGDIAFVPQQTGLLPPEALVCDPSTSGTLAPPVGDPAPANGVRVPWRAVVTFPSCDLVALIELPSGDILDSYQATSTALVPKGRNPVCPATDCGYINANTSDAGAAETQPSPSDAGTVAVDGSAASDGGSIAGSDGGSSSPAVAARVGSLGISALAMHPEGKRIYFGGTNTSSVFTLDIEGTHFVDPAATGASLASLSEGAGGTVRMRLSVDPFAYSKGHDANDSTRAEYGRFVAGRHDNQPDDPLEFLYVAAKDGSLRVLDVAQPVPVECDQNIDPTDPLAQAIPDGYAPMDSSKPPDPELYRKACFAYKGMGNPRRLLPGTFPGRRFSGALQDFAFANYRSPPTNTPATPTVDEELMNGAFAFVMTNAGTVYVLNIDPVLRTTKQVVKQFDVNGAVSYVPGDVPESPRPLTHSSRDFNYITYASNLGTQIGPPRLDTTPTQIVDGPHLMKFDVSESRVNGRIIPATTLPADTYVYFPNRATVHPQAWRILWEGDITGVRNTGDIVDPIPGAGQFAPLMTTITDNGSGFCAFGAAEGDVMTLAGCDTDAGCTIPGTTCVHSDRVPPTADGRPIQGMCLPRSMTDHSACEEMLKTFRRYEIVSVANGATTVLPRRDEIHRPAFTNADGVRATCHPATDDQRTKGMKGHSIDCAPITIPSQADFDCVPVTPRQAARSVMSNGIVREGDPSLRCLQRCKKDDECREGRACVDYGDGKFCAEGAPILQSCGLDQLFSYKLSVGDGFLVTGSVSGRTEAFKTVTTDSGPTCVRDPVVPDLVARIAMNSPLCDADSTPTISQSDKNIRTWDNDFLGKVTDPNYPKPGPCLVFDQPDATVPAVVSAVFQNTELRFVLTDLQKSFLNTAQIQFGVNGGVSAQTAFPSSDALPGLPSRILLGPIPSVPFATACPPETAGGCAQYSDLPYLFVVDQRAYSGGRLGARGQILRVTPRISAAAPYAGFESFVLSGRYFPIQ